MKADCLNERDLILLHYGEVPDGTTSELAAAHLAACAACRLRSRQLAADLAHIPAVADPDPVVATRIAARVNERLERKRRWLPLAGAAVAGAIVLATAILVWIPDAPSPVNSSPPQLSAARPPVTTIQPAVTRQAALDLDLLDKLDLLEELETLQAIEGV